MTELETNTLYIALSARNDEGDYHWALLLPFSPTKYGYYDATNSAAVGGRWTSQILEEFLPVTSHNLVSIYRVGSISAVEGARNKVEEICRTVQANGEPSLRTGKNFNCKVWVQDVLFKLDGMDVLKLKKSLDDIEIEIFRYADSVEDEVLAGKRPALVINDTLASKY
ncbi:uncharacterized protein BP5553_04818 [Venustampulla echinocandica]|uniref:Uncharacterized protein n=1 Tax=Venustampulla echinocandica TaxID=2656787 RepID=A0A370TPE1_9HELO|nr:uncharacterized protein BP5553_04818 [Venustampulla echinocandica]RDL37385.1 hypothetical protein BP5553_04818 [Venustampulla echinocandica]